MSLVAFVPRRPDLSHSQGNNNAAQQKLSVTDNRKLNFALHQRAIGMQRRAAYAGQAGVVQRESELTMQQGPSCWLFVLEAIAKAKGIGTKYLSIAMNAYPDSDSAIEKQKQINTKGVKVTKRAAALQLIVENTTEMLAKLDNWKTSEGGTRANGIIEQRLVKRYARQTLNSDESVNHITFSKTANTIQVDQVIQAYTQAKRRAKILFDIVSSGDDAPETLLNTGAQMIGHDQALDDVHEGLKVQSTPSYVSVKKRFKLGKDDDGNHVDFTNKNINEMKSTNHAILLDNYDADTKTVTYKDPNYGNISIFVTHEQFQAMAGGEQMRMLPFFRDGKIKSKMEQVKD